MTARGERPPECAMQKHNPSSIYKILRQILKAPPNAWGFNSDSEKLEWVAKVFESLTKAVVAAAVTGSKAKAKKVRRKPRRKTT